MTGLSEVIKFVVKEKGERSNMGLPDTALIIQKVVVVTGKSLYTGRQSEQAECDAKLKCNQSSVRAGQNKGRRIIKEWEVVVHKTG